MLKAESTKPSYARIMGLPPRGYHRRWPRIVLRCLVGLVLVVVLAVGAGVLWLRSAEMTALPVLDGDLHIDASDGSGLSAPVTVRRDAHGVPHIEAANQSDLFVAQGYVTAQDRLWQMDALRRNANGELAEVFGSSLLAHDKAQRVFQFRRTAERIYANQTPVYRARLDDYAHGVNLFIAQHANSLPAEFRLLHYRPKPWTGVDSVSIGLILAQGLDMHWEPKLAREHIAAELHNPKLEADLYPVGSWRDHAPTGTVVDWSQPHPAPPAKPGSDDDDDDRSQASTKAPSKTDNLLRVKSTGFSPYNSSAESRRASRAAETLDLAAISRGFVTGHDFSRAASATKSTWALAPEGFGRIESAFPRGLKPMLAVQLAMYGLKPVPFTEAASGDLRASLGLDNCAGCVPGSNNWVIAGAHTASGKPLLSNDMHLSLTEPNIWYMADLLAPGFHAAGVTMPGIPCVIAGHNDHVAWGFTALYADVQDLYVETLDGRGNYQATDGSFKPLAVDHEVIHVRGGKDVLLDVQSTAHGPLLNPIFTRETRPIALKWALYDPSLNALPIFQLDTASNWTEFSAALAAWCWPTQNLVYSDDQGHIAYHAIGRVPLRLAGLQGLPIKDNAHEWQGYIPFDAMPNAFDPPAGFLATANSRVTTDASPYPLSLEWVDPYRTQRIYKALQGRDQLTSKDMLAVQTDVYSEVDQEIGHRLAYAIDHTAGTDEGLRKAADLMRSWDGRLTTDSAAASIVTQARRALWPLILEPKLGKDAGDYRWSESNFAEEEIVMHASPEWLPKAYKNWDALLTEAVRKGMKDGKAPGDVAFWRYGGWHVVDIEHPLAPYLPIVSRIAGTGPQPLSGDTTTVKQVGRDFGPSQRFTMDWNNIDGSTENIALGESGDPYSPYYRDQWNDYLSGSTFALPFTPQAVAAQTRHTLHLLP